ncbi:RagB/SusD family nutrient uptake outer membrane protein [Spirosoma utsteinense]|uniref:RagB/SusD family nutrient uptake outer membrane protein n=1 Tax=Spirosoma utsteinense TaxID=2585773 RepID=A0ABR6WEB9_9BACT|nr:RagB/SusD family nutrient uptake outer membrane protein [Spirosoma utsteinense]MBC3787513.1 hypothetical protein [Spirosoma utsteinense]MBC3794896.1 hypothetical protein [Spirosoma utsteinense]
MKSINTLILLGLFSLLASCDVLDQAPQAEVSESIAVTNKKGANAALAGLYNQLQDGNYYGRNLQIMGDVASDISQSVGTWDFYREMDTYVTAPANRENAALWTRGYRAINIANTLIANVPTLSDLTDAEKNVLLGQAYFVRGLVYFDLTRVYAGVPGVVGTLGVPIVLTPSKSVDESLFPGRPTLQASYDQVEADLLKATELLPESYASDITTRSQAVKPTAKALLSRLYLYINQPAKVIQYASDVISSPKYALAPSYESIFSGKFTAESVFELNFGSTDQSGMRNWYFPSSLGGRGDIAIHESFYQELVANPKDARGKLVARDNTVNVYYSTKYQKPGNIDNAHIIRIAEVYLNRAEARAQSGDLAGALADMNLIRNRAGVESSTVSGVQPTLEAIWQERKLELAFEGHRFFDLVRTNQAVKKLVNVARKNGPPVTLNIVGRQVFPIPLADIDSNKNLSQNDGYK